MIPIKQKLALFNALVMLLCLAAFAFIVLHGLGCRVNRSDSLPGLLYRVVPLGTDEELNPGDCVLIDLPRLNNPVIAQGMERGYVSAAFNQPMLKRIAAIPGDTVDIHDGSLFVDDRELTRITVASRDSYGGKLSEWPTLIMLPQDHYWLVSDPERGFDSRYFGPINRNVFTHRAKPVF